MKILLFTHPRSFQTYITLFISQNTKYFQFLLYNENKWGLTLPSFEMAKKRHKSGPCDLSLLKSLHSFVRRLKPI